MYQLIVEMSRGADCAGQARLFDEDRRLVAQGWAVIGARPGFASVEPGQYAGLRVLQSLPPARGVVAEFGSHAVVLRSLLHGELLMAHGGNLHEGGRVRPTAGSLRLEGAVMDALARRLWPRVSGSQRPPIALKLDIGEPPSAWRFWARPGPSQQVDPTAGGDFFRDVVPMLAPHRDANAAVCWNRWFAAEAKRRPGSGGDRADDDWTSPPDRDTGFADTVPPDGAVPAALFAVDELAGTDRFGRVTHADPAPFAGSADAGAAPTIDFGNAGGGADGWSDAPAAPASSASDSWGGGGTSY